MVQNPYSGIESNVCVEAGQAIRNPFNGIERELLLRAPTTNPAMDMNPFNGIEGKGYDEDEVLKLIEGEYERLMGLGLSRQSVL
jgi:hypothetical protein